MRLFREGEVVFLLGKGGGGVDSEVEGSNRKEEQNGGSEKCTTSLGVDSHI
jgi:hypothetical protein